MPFILPGNVGSATAATGFSVDNSCRFNDDDSAHLTRTQGTATNTKICTFSAWVKRGNLTDYRLFSAESGSFGTQFWIILQGAGPIYMANYESSYSMQLVTTAKFRDPSAWYHFCIAIDTTEGTSTDRIKLFVNNVRQTSYSTSTFPSEDLVPNINDASINLAIGKRDAEEYMDGYLAEVAFIDGTALAPTAFGEFDEDSPTIWKPKDFKDDVTFGNNGYYLDFADSGDLGDDESGNGNDWTEVNLAAADQATDTCTNNFATFNLLDVPEVGEKPTLSIGNLQGVSTNGGHISGISSIGISSGKYYAEFKAAAGDTGNLLAGIITDPTSALGSTSPHDSSKFYGARGNGTKFTASTASADWGSTWSINDIIGLGIDLDNNRLYISKNGQWSDGSGNYDETNPTAYVTLASGQTYFVLVGDAGGTVSATWQGNFGGCPAFAISSGNADGDGFGNFEYAVPSGYFALCTKNLAEYG